MSLPSPFPTLVASSLNTTLRECVRVRASVGCLPAYKEFPCHQPASTIVIRCNYQSAPRDLLPARRRGPSGPLPARATYPVAIKTPERDGNWSGVSQRFASLLARGLPTIFPQSVRGTFRAGVMNLFGLTKAARRLFGTLRQFCQEPRCVPSVLNCPSPLCVVAHENDNDRRTRLDVGYA